MILLNSSFLEAFFINSNKDNKGFKTCTLDGRLESRQSGMSFQHRDSSNMFLRHAFTGPSITMTAR